ncbi:hypothetical protein SERLADRAFT_434991 [Serpula lacrymans var. lacrymans S7.9]|uniref:C2H2-type domain-containing protein n=1 Tax=Serpula lacrymans var. lacrymans (strain S7.9) TaxID=578457 RepID=F8NPR4_SERL9|nr:uncharacterized protein SERLADRAFT_434991 [Serpula lacrymans var. lacrymans S7.9]EGO27220.1 hypothetical protein SERLADRAFT_434991 [Serpula lacrymans var. lacrymans S7.9]
MTSSLTLSTDHVLQLSKQHLNQHCWSARIQENFYNCSLPRCAGRAHGSVAALKTHVELSHLSRVALSCPARGCDQLFGRTTALETHFVTSHWQLVNTVITFPSATINATAIPFAPQIKRFLPPLPDSPVPAHLAVPLVFPNQHLKRKSSPQEPISRKWSRMEVQDEEDGHEHIAFDNLNHSVIQKSTGPFAVEVHLKPPNLDRQLSRPLPIVSSPRRFNVPRSMLFDELIKRNALDVVDSRSGL